MTDLDTILAQHASLRDAIDRCEQLADELAAGRGDLERAVREVAELRRELDAHNRFEEQVLRPAFDHVAEHRALHDSLGDPVIGELRWTLDHLRAHLEEEERWFALRNQPS